MTADPADIRRDLVALALPAALSLLVHSLFRVNDQFFVQGLGVEAQAAVGVGGMVAIGYLGFGQLVAVGTLAITARRLGEGDAHAAGVAARTGIVTAVVVALALTAVTVPFLGSLVEMLVPGADDAVERTLTLDYLGWIAGGQVVLAVLPTIDAVFLAHKRARISLLLQTVAVVTNVALNAVLVPRHGVAGAGAATVLSRGIAVVLGLVAMRLVEVRLRGPVARPVAFRALRIGLPACLSILLYSVVYQVLLHTTLARFGAGGRSALGVGFGIETMLFCFQLGVGSAVASLVGRALGAGDRPRIDATVALATRWNLALGTAGGLLFFFAGEPLVRLLADDPVAIAANTEYLAVLAWAQPFQGMNLVLDQAMIGAGATTAVMVNTTLGNVVRIPLGHLLAVPAGLGLPGVWWAINASCIGKWLGSLWLFRRGRWADTRV